MRALVLTGPGRAFELTEVPDPAPGPGEAVARIVACGAGLTIQHVKAGRAGATFPRIVGHEIAGEIVALGAGVDTLRVGDKVTAHFYLFCGHCRECLAGFEPLCVNLEGMVGRVRDGGYAEYVALPARNFVRLPEGIGERGTAAEIAVIADALATPYKVLRRTRLRAGETMAVFGAGGGLGLHQVMMARWAGARVIGIDVAAGKEAACLDAGAETMVNPRDGDPVEALQALTGGRGVDVVVDYVSTHETLNQGAAALNSRGRYVTLGGGGQDAALPGEWLRRGEREFMGSRYVSRAEIIETLALCAGGAVWPIISEVAPMEQAEALHARIEAGAVTGRAAIAVAAQ